jgi:hypothetical protein
LYYIELSPTIRRWAFRHTSMWHPRRSGLKKRCDASFTVPQPPAKVAPGGRSQLFLGSNAGPANGRNFRNIQPN